MDLSIIIVNYKTKDLLDECLESVVKNIKQVKFELIVIDNNSQDGSVQMLKEKYPQVILIKNQNNLGFAKACNQGIKRSCGKYLFFLNPDTLIDSNIFANIIEFLEANPKVGVGGCFLYYPDRSPQASFYRFPTILTSIGKMFSLFRILPRNIITSAFFEDYSFNNISNDIDRACGAAMIVRRKAIEQAGGFDEDYFMYNEELDLCYRIKERGWEISPIPETKVIHYHQQGGQQNAGLTTFHKIKTELLFFKKFHSWYKVLIIRMIQFLGILFRVLFWLIKYLLVKKQKRLNRGKLCSYLKLLFSNLDYSKSLFNMEVR